MEKIMKRVKSLVLACVLLLCNLDLAVAQDPTTASSNGAQIERVLLQAYDIDGTDKELRLYLITYPPGASAPKHHHPVVGLGYVIEGSAKSTFEGEQTKIYRAGSSFVDRAITEHIEFWNLSSTEPLRFLISYAIKKGEKTLEIPWGSSSYISVVRTMRVATEYWRIGKRIAVAERVRLEPGAAMPDALFNVSIASDTRHPRTMRSFVEGHIRLAFSRVADDLRLRAWLKHVRIISQHGLKLLKRSQKKVRTLSTRVRQSTIQQSNPFAPKRALRLVWNKVIWRQKMPAATREQAILLFASSLVVRLVGPPRT
jgi:quercetin dioxygenase-like cupin family protein